MLKVIYWEHKEIINYLIFGFLAFLVSMGTYFIARLVFNYVISNIISWIVAVIFAYMTNKAFVFQSITNSIQALIKEFVSFIAGRAFTLFLETFTIYLLFDVVGFNEFIVKVIGQAVVIITNYLLSKFFIFKKD